MDDRIYPRAKSRIGAKYQATVADWDTTNNRSLSPSSSDMQSPKPFKSKKSDKKKLNVQQHQHKSYGNKRLIEKSPSAEPLEPILDPAESMIPIRGGDDTITCLYRPNILHDEQSNVYT